MPSRYLILAVLVSVFALGFVTLADTPSASSATVEDLRIAEPPPLPDLRIAQAPALPNFGADCPAGTVYDLARHMCVPLPTGHFRCADGISTCPLGWKCNPGGAGRDACLAPVPALPGLGGPGCPDGTVYDLARHMCVPLPTGHFPCADGISTCPVGTECNPIGVGRDACIAPGSKPCQAGGVTSWCAPPTVCDAQRGLCVQKLAAPASDQVCPDGLTVCPVGTACNPEGVGRDACLAPGSVRCQAGGQLFWCGPGQACDHQRARCTQRAAARVGEQVCPDGVTVCPASSQCNPEGVGRDACLAPGSVRCQAGSQLFWCAPGQACDHQRARCTQRGVARGGEQVCPDGLTVCPANYQCNPEGVGRDACLAPGSSRCQAGGQLFWCGPEQACDYQRGLCTKRAVARGGEQVCPDGLTVCPASYRCNPEGVGRDACLPPGATPCRGSQGTTFWCRPPQVCDYARALCTNKVSVPPGHHLCPDGLSTCPTGTTCNPEGVGRDACLPPGATVCRGSQGSFWCRAPQVCDYSRGRCTDKVGVPPGHHLCPDGLSSCPTGTTCNPEGVGRDACLPPGATRCDFYQGGRPAPTWCIPPQVCDYQRMRCTDRVTGIPPKPDAPPQKTAPPPTTGGPCMQPVCHRAGQTDCINAGQRGTPGWLAACIGNMEQRCNQGEAGGTGQWCVRKGSDPDCRTRATRVCKESERFK